MISVTLGKVSSPLGGETTLLAFPGREKRKEFLEVGKSGKGTPSLRDPSEKKIRDETLHILKKGEKTEPKTRSVGTRRRKPEP